MFKPTQKSVDSWFFNRVSKKCFQQIIKVCFVSFILIPIKCESQAYTMCADKIKKNVRKVYKFFMFSTIATLASLQAYLKGKRRRQRISKKIISILVITCVFTAWLASAVYEWASKWESMTFKATIILCVRTTTAVSISSIANQVWNINLMFFRTFFRYVQNERGNKHSSFGAFIFMSFFFLGLFACSILWWIFFF